MLQSHLILLPLLFGSLEHPQPSISSAFQDEKVEEQEPKTESERNHREATKVGEQIKSLSATLDTWAVPSQPCSACAGSLCKEHNESGLAALDACKANWEERTLEERLEGIRQVGQACQAHPQHGHPRIEDFLQKQLESED